MLPALKATPGMVSTSDIWGYLGIFGLLPLAKTDFLC
jgi:hypothetical protein